MIHSRNSGNRGSDRRFFDRTTRNRSRCAGVGALLAVLGLVASGCTKGSTAAAATPGTRTYEVSASNFVYAGMPATIARGNIQINFTNKESVPIVHEMIVLALPVGKTPQDLIDSAKVPGCTGGAACESQYLHFGEIADVATGATVSDVFSLPPGNYFFACWQKGTPAGTEDGPTHLSLGMLYQFSVT